MAKDLSITDRKKLDKKLFALPNRRKYPIPNKAHARNALVRVAQHGTTVEQKKAIADVRNASQCRSRGDLERLNNRPQPVAGTIGRRIDPVYIGPRQSGAL